MLTSIGSNSSIAWDDNGQLICDGGINFVYDYDNKLDYASSVSGPTIYVDYEYDPLGNLSGRSDYVQGIGTRQSRYIQDYSGGLPKVLVELEPDGSGGWSVVAQNYHYGDRLVLSQSASGNSSYYIHDRNGNVRNIINSSQTVLNSYSYTAYGEDIASQCFETVPNNWKFSGQYHDKQLDQYYLRARMYSPYLSRFNGYDPVLGSYQEPLTLHQYLYCLNDPVNYTDPTGRFSLPEVKVSAGGSASLSASSTPNLLGYLSNTRNFVSMMNTRNWIYGQTIAAGSQGNPTQWARAMNAIGNQIHHIVSRGYGNTERFGREVINGLNNLIALPGPMHGQITSFMNSGHRIHQFMASDPNRFGQFRTLQQYVCSLPIDKQFNWGTSMLMHLSTYGNMTGFDPVKYGLY